MASKLLTFKHKISADFAWERLINTYRQKHYFNNTPNLEKVVREIRYGKKVPDSIEVSYGRMVKGFADCSKREYTAWFVNLNITYGTESYSFVRMAEDDGLDEAFLHDAAISIAKEIWELFTNEKDVGLERPTNTFYCGAFLPSELNLHTADMPMAVSDFQEYIKEFHSAYIAGSNGTMEVATYPIGLGTFTLKFNKKK